MPQEEEKTVGPQVGDVPSSPDVPQKDYSDHIREWFGLGHVYTPGSYTFLPCVAPLPSFLDPQRNWYGGGYFSDPMLKALSQASEMTPEDVDQKLTLRINQLFMDAAVTWQRIAKDREVVQTLKEDTRATLRRMRG